MNDLLLRLGMDDISEFFDECYEKALKEDAIPFWLDENYIRKTAEEFPFLENNLDDVLRALPAVIENPDLVMFAKTLYHMLEVNKHHEEVFEGLAFPKAPEGENSLGYDMFSFYPMFSRIRDAYAGLREKGVDEAILNTTAAGVGGSLTASSERVGRLAFSRIYFLWCTTHKNAALLSVGRFAFEIRKNSKLNIRVLKNTQNELKILMTEGVHIHDNGFILGSVGAENEENSFVTQYNETAEFYEGNEAESTPARVNKTLTKLLKSEWECIYSPGDSVVELHIPVGKPLTHEVVDGALNEGRRVIKSIYPEENFKIFSCFSWLLAPELKDILKPESNIMKFAERFTKYPMKCEGLDIFSFVFIKSISKIEEVDLDSLPENSSLEKNLKEYYKAGNFVHETGGVFLF